MFRKIVDFFKREIQLNREYYHGPENAPFDPQVLHLVQGSQGPETALQPEMWGREDDFYKQVRLLAQNGQIQRAYAEKAHIDAYCEHRRVDLTRKLISQLIDSAKTFDTDLVLMNSHGCSCPECAKYQGRVFSLSGRSRQFPKIPVEFFKYGGIHPGCGHTFSTYIHGVTDPMLDYTLSFQTAVKERYRGDIVAFSNRPFVDDRLPEDIEKALAHEAKLAEERQQAEYYRAHMIEIEAQRGVNKRNYKWLQGHLPDLCPKSYSGYMRMKNGNTKNYQTLAARARELGREI